MANLTTAKIQALAFNAVGRGVETRNSSPFVLALSNGNSTISVGYLQWDFGSRSKLTSVFTDLTQTYNQWATQNNQPQLKGTMEQWGSDSN